MNDCCNIVKVIAETPPTVKVYTTPYKIGGAAGGSIPTIETAIGLVNGSNAIFTSSFPFLSSTLEVFENGQLLTLLIDYTVLTNQSIQLNFSPNVGEIIKFIYIKS